MKSIYLHRDDVETILQFLKAFPEARTVEVTCDDSSGIGSIINATVHHVVVNGMNGTPVSVTKNIVDESSW